jgi:hypothetical protein
VFWKFPYGLKGVAQQLALPAKAGIGGELPKGEKSQWCKSTQKRRTTPLLSGAPSQDGAIIFAVRNRPAAQRHG